MGFGWVVVVSEGEGRDSFALGRIIGRWESDYDYGMGSLVVNLWLHLSDSPIEITQN